MKPRISLLILVLGVTCVSFSQNGGTALKPKTTTLQPVKPVTAGFSDERLKILDNNISSWVSDDRLNGAVALIIRNGKIVYHKAFGYDDPEKTKPIRTDNIYRIASQTKAITSTAIMMLFPATFRSLPNSRCWINSMKPTAVIQLYPPNQK